MGTTNITTTNREIYNASTFQYIIIIIGDDIVYTITSMCTYFFCNKMNSELKARTMLGLYSPLLT